MPAAGVRGFACAKFIVRQRASDGSTRLEEIRGSQVHCGSQFQPGLSPTMTATFNAVQPVRPDALGETTVQLLELSSALDAPEISFTQSNTITLHVTADIAASTPVDTLPVYDGWKSVFTLLDSSFGKQYVLLDQSTHLEWLRLSATRNKSQEDLRHAMLPHKALDGWRYATAEEVAALFRHFTATPSGRSNDPAVVTDLQRLMGGPFYVAKSTAGDWTRSITYGRIAGYYPNEREGVWSTPRSRACSTTSQRSASATTITSSRRSPTPTAWAVSTATAAAPTQERSSSASTDAPPAKNHAASTCGDGMNDCYGTTALHLEGELSSHLEETGG